MWSTMSTHCAVRKSILCLIFFFKKKNKLMSNFKENKSQEFLKLEIFMALACTCKIDLKFTSVKCILHLD